MADQARQETNQETNQKKHVNQESSGKVPTVTYMGITDVDFYNMVNKQKAISGKVNFDSAKVLKQLEYMSALGEYDVQFGNLPLEKWPIIKFMSDLILPAKVSLTGKENETDFLVHPVVQDIDELPMSLSEWIDTNEVLAQALTKKTSSCTTLENIKTNVLLQNVKNPINPHTNKCLNDISIAWPLTIAVHKDNRMNEDPAFVNEVALREAIRNYRSGGRTE